MEESIRSSSDHFRSAKCETQSENRSQFVRYEPSSRTLPMRRSTSLKLDGDLDIIRRTENAEQFIEYLLTQRRSLIRNPTHLHLEGDMERETENREQYKPLTLQPRPLLIKKLTNLRLQGDLHTNTENQDHFIEHQLEVRPPLVKRNTILKMEGDLALNPEYRQAFVEFEHTGRSSPSLPRHNLKVDGFFESSTENHSNFTGHHGHPPIPFLRGAAAVASRPKNLALDGDFQTLTENRHEYGAKVGTRSQLRRAASQLHLEGQLDLHPEYKNAYVDFYKTSNFSSPVRQRRMDDSRLLYDTGPDMEVSPEYKRSYVDFPRQRPRVPKPEAHLSTKGTMDHMTEKRAQYVVHPRYNKADVVKHEPELKLEGEFVCQPEYRKAYIDYLIRERVDRKTRPLDNLVGNVVQDKRAFEVVPAAATTKPLPGPPIATNNAGTSKVAASATNGTSTSSETNIGKSLLPKHTTSTTKSKVEAAVVTTSSNVHATQSRIPRRQVSISKLETQLFGPKIEMPSTRRSSSSSRLTSRSPSPRARTRSLSTRSTKQSSLGDGGSQQRHDRTGSRFPSSVRVADMAYTPSTAPISTHKLYTYSPRKKWSQPARDINEQVDRMTAFMVLDDRDDVNNNLDGFTNRNPVKSLYKEQKWMNSWNTSNDTL